MNKIIPYISCLFANTHQTFLPFSLQGAGFSDIMRKNREAAAAKLALAEKNSGSGGNGGGSNIISSDDNGSSGSGYNGNGSGNGISNRNSITSSANNSNNNNNIVDTDIDSNTSAKSTHTNNTISNTNSSNTNSSKSDTDTSASLQKVEKLLTTFSPGRVRSEKDSSKDDTAARWDNIFFNCFNDFFRNLFIFIDIFYFYFMDILKICFSPLSRYYHVIIMLLHHQDGFCSLLSYLIDSMNASS